MAVNSIRSEFAPGINALYSDRQGGSSLPPYDGYNLGMHVADNEQHVLMNRTDFQRHLPQAPCWLNQVHSNRVIDAAISPSGVDADASFTNKKNIPCVVMVADCLPILLADKKCRVVAAVHGGWRGLASGIIGRTIQAMDISASDIQAWLGPAIGPSAFQVGAEVRETFVEQSSVMATAFIEDGDRYLADIKKIARIQLNQLAVEDIVTHPGCTYSDSAHFFSYRRDGQTGRMAAAIWLE